MGNNLGIQQEPSLDDLRRLLETIVEAQRVERILQDLQELNYKPIKRLGSGAFGEAWLVEDKRNNTRYAAKYLELSQHDIATFEQEWKMLKSLNHENIVKYVDHVEWAQIRGFYIIMEFCGGGNLLTVIRTFKAKSGRMPEDRIWYWSLQIFAALEYMHSRDPIVLHRDLKPDNLFLTTDRKTIKLGDFGLSRHLATSTDLATTQCGCIPYMSPDRARGNCYNHKEDIWTAGCCVLEMMLLELPTKVDWDEDAGVARSVEVKPVPAGHYSNELIELTNELLSLKADDRPDMSTVLSRPSIVNKKQSLKYELLSPIPTLPQRDLSDDDDDSQSDLTCQLLTRTLVPRDDPQEELLRLGYSFNAKGVLTSEDDLGYKHVNNEGYEAICNAMTKYLDRLLIERYRMIKITIPLNAKSDEPTTFIYGTRDLNEQVQKILILVHGSGKVKAGQWSRRLIINDTIDDGSQIPCLVEARKYGYAVIIANMNDNSVIIDSVHHPIRNSDTPLEHLQEIWRFIMSKCPAAKVAIFAHSDGGTNVVQLATEIEDNFLERTFAVAFEDSMHEQPCITSKLSNKVKKFLLQHSRNYIPSDKPLDEQLPRGKNTSPRYSAGTREHERTPRMVVEPALRFLEGEFDGRSRQINKNCKLQ